MAARLGVVMGIENVDGTDVNSIRKAMEFVKLAHSPYLQVYPDIGNIAERQLDASIELEAGRGHMVAIHVKDVRPGEPRRVPMGRCLRHPCQAGLARPNDDRDVERRCPRFQ